jgi:flagellar protein FliO/FliZ
MNRSMTLTRAALRAAIPALGSAVGACAGALTCLAALACVPSAQAFTPSSKAGGEGTPLDLSPTTGAHASTAGPSLVRTIVGLLIVIAVIWGLTWILRQVKSGRTRDAVLGAGLASLATLPLGSGRSLHLVQAGSDYLLVGSAEHGVAPIHRYTEQQARDAGLLDPPEQQDDAELAGPLGRGRSRAMQIPGQAAPGTARDAAVQLLDRVRDWTVRR